MDERIGNLSVPERLKKARGIESRQSAAKAVGVSVSSLGMYESGVRTPRPEIMKRLAAHYRTTVQALFFDE